MYRKWLKRSKRIAALSLAGAMVFGSISVFAEEGTAAFEVQQEESIETLAGCQKLKCQK